MASEQWSPYELAMAVQRLEGRDALRVGKAVYDSLRPAGRRKARVSRLQLQLLLLLLLFGVMLCVAYRLTSDAAWARGGDAAPAQSLHARSGAAAFMGRAPQPAPLAEQLITMRQGDIRLKHGDDDSGESAAAQQRWERGDGPPLPLLLLALTSSVCLPVPVCWYREQETKTPAATPELPVGVQRFVPRPAVSEALHQALGNCTDETSRRLARPLPSPAHHTDSRVTVLRGGQGVGKTQLALVHSPLPRSPATRYRLRWWTSAEQRDGLQAQYRHFAQAVGIFFNVSGHFPALVPAVNTWLSARRDWLVVFDNAPYISISHQLPPPPQTFTHLIPIDDSL